MKNILSVPFLRHKLSIYITISAVVGIVIGLFLIIFQPFNTSNFIHGHKNLILLGYGIVVFVVLVIYYIISWILYTSRKQDQWSIVHEVVELFIGVCISISSCYIYALILFGWKFSFLRFITFFGMAASIAIIPVLFYLVVLYFKWKDAVRSHIDVDQGAINSQIILQGQNKKDRLELVPDDLRVIKSHDNYVMLYLLDQGKQVRHIIRSTLKDIHQQLSPEAFIQVHRSYVVNKNALVQINGNKAKASLSLKDISIPIPVSRSHYDQVKSLL